jgi:hypothetical protein
MADYAALIRPTRIALQQTDIRDGGPVITAANIRVE